MIKREGNSQLHRHYTIVLAPGKVYVLVVYWIKQKVTASPQIIKSSAISKYTQFILEISNKGGKLTRKGSVNYITLCPIYSGNAIKPDQKSRLTLLSLPPMLQISIIITGNIYKPTKIYPWGHWPNCDTRCLQHKCFQMAGVRHIHSKQRHKEIHCVPSKDIQK